MEMEKTMKTLVTICAMIAMVGMSTSIQAVTVDFEGGGYTLAADGAATIALSTEQSLSSSHSVKIQLSNASPGVDFGKINVPYSGSLNQTTATAWDYIPSSNTRPELAPYIYFILDSDNSGTYNYPNDSLVIAFISGSTANPTDTWFQTSLDASTKVHVVGNRTGLGTTEFSASNSPLMGTLGDLRSKTFSGSTTYGDLNVIIARVGAGEWPDASNYTAYVDNVSVVPEPATMALLGLGGLLFARKKK
jgi:hypothetical protein